MEVQVWVVVVVVMVMISMVVGVGWLLRDAKPGVMIVPNPEPEEFLKQVLYRMDDPYVASNLAEGLKRYINKEPPKKHMVMMVDVILRRR